MVIFGEPCEHGVPDTRVCRECLDNKKYERSETVSDKEKDDKIAMQIPDGSTVIFDTYIDPIHKRILDNAVRTLEEYDEHLKRRFDRAITIEGTVKIHPSFMEKARREFQEEICNDVTRRLLLQSISELKLFFERPRITILDKKE